MSTTEALLAASIRYEDLKKQKAELLKTLERIESRMDYLLELKARIEAESENRIEQSVI